MRENRETLLSADKSTAVILEPIGEGKIRVRTSTWDQEVVILADQALEVVAMGKSLRVVRAPRPPGVSGLRSDGFLPTRTTGRSSKVTASHT